MNQTENIQPSFQAGATEKKITLYLRLNAQDSVLRLLPLVLPLLFPSKAPHFLNRRGLAVRLVHICQRMVPISNEWMRIWDKTLKDG